MTSFPTGTSTPIPTVTVFTRYTTTTDMAVNFTGYVFAW